jgi:hypothetical protein
MAEEVSPASEVDFEVATEFGLPKSVRTAPGSKFWRGYDFNFWDLAVRYTWMYIAEADIRDLRQLTNSALDADNRLVFSRVMRTLFNPLNRTGIMDNNLPVTVYAFYNGDGEVPPTVGPAPSWARTATTSPRRESQLGDAHAAGHRGDGTHLDHHGYTFQAGYKQGALGQRPGVPDHAAVEGRQRRTLGLHPQRPGLRRWGLRPRRHGPVRLGAQGNVPGQVGTYGPWHVVKEDYIPAGYVAGLVSGGPDNISNPIGLREHKNPAYRGLKLIPGDKNGYPLIESFYQRGVGTGIRHRGAGVLLQVTGRQLHRPGHLRLIRLRARNQNRRTST